MKLCYHFFPMLSLGGLFDVIAANQSLDVSLIQLIARPNEFHGKRVRVIGYVRVEHEGDAVYLHEEDYKKRISKNGLWLDFPKEVVKKSREYDQRYCLIEGVFNAKNTGHMDLFSGSIKKVTRIQAWEQR